MAGSRWLTRVAKHLLGKRMKEFRSDIRGYVDMCQEKDSSAGI